MDAVSMWLFGGIGVSMLGSLGWAFKVQRNMLTRREHAAICTKSSEDTVEKLDQVLKIIKQNREDSIEARQLDREAAKEHRDKVHETLEELRSDVGDLKTDVAVLKSQVPRRGRTG